VVLIGSCRTLVGRTSFDFFHVIGKVKELKHSLYTSRVLLGQTRTILFRISLRMPKRHLDGVDQLSNLGLRNDSGEYKYVRVQVKSVEDVSHFWKKHLVLVCDETAWNR